jgi:hypothetical protein
MFQPCFFASSGSKHNTIVKLQLYTIYEICTAWKFQIVFPPLSEVTSFTLSSPGPGFCLKGNGSSRVLYNAGHFLIHERLFIGLSSDCSKGLFTLQHYKNNFISLTKVKPQNNLGIFLKSATLSVILWWFIRCVSKRVYIYIYIYIYSVQSYITWQYRFLRQLISCCYKPSLGFVCIL